MQITEVRIKLMDDPHERLQGFCSITLDSCFVIRDLKIIQGTKGSFVAMPSRKLTDRCPKCYTKNHLRALHCNQCGARLQEERATKDTDGRAKLYADIAHPINSECRDMIQTRVLRAYEEELVRSNQSDYVCTYDDYGEEQYAALVEYADDDPIARPKVVQAGNDATHRIDPAPGASAQSPHSGSSKANVQTPPTTSASESHSRDSCENENFGAGII